ncbi:MAG: hypothetical protein RR319_01180 [Bacteroides sp.]
MATRGRRLPHKLEQLICEKYNKGVLLREIAKTSDVSDATIMKVLRRNKVTLRKRKQISPEKEKLIVCLYRAGESIARIKLESNVKSEQTIYRILKDAKIQLRSKK